MPWYGGLIGFRREEPLAPLTSFGLGGPAEFYCEPPGEEALALTLRRAAEARVPVNVLGHGTNLLVADAGVSGLVIRLPEDSFGRFRAQGERLLVGGAQSLPGLVLRAAQRGWGGLETLAGVPGSVGAALRGNSGGRTGEIAARVLYVAGFRWDGAPFCHQRSDCGFGYRRSLLQDAIVTRCEMQIESAAPETCCRRVKDLLHAKCATQPVVSRSAGCVFKNPASPVLPPAGRLIEGAGLKGFRIGGASVSRRHANFIVCTGEARASHVAQVIRFIRQRIYREFGIRLELEIETWGFAPGELPAVEAA